MEAKVKRLLRKFKRNAPERYQLLKTLAKQEGRTLSVQLAVALQVFHQGILLKDPLALRFLKQGNSPPLRLVWDRDKEEKKELLPKGK